MAKRGQGTSGTSDHSLERDTRAKASASGRSLVPSSAPSKPITECHFGHTISPRRASGSSSMTALSASNRAVAVLGRPRWSRHSSARVDAKRVLERAAKTVDPFRPGADKARPVERHNAAPTIRIAWSWRCRV